jgi:hypothetical protein
LFTSLVSPEIDRRIVPKTFYYISRFLSSAGEYDPAIGQLEYLPSISAGIPAPLLKIWLDFVMLHAHPRFQALIGKYE